MLANFETVEEVDRAMLPSNLQIVDTQGACVRSRRAVRLPPAPHPAPVPARVCQLWRAAPPWVLGWGRSGCAQAAAATAAARLEAERSHRLIPRWLCATALRRRHVPEHPPALGGGRLHGRLWRAGAHGA